MLNYDRRLYQSRSISQRNARFCGDEASKPLSVATKLYTNAHRHNHPRESSLHRPKKVFRWPAMRLSRRLMNILPLSRSHRNEFNMVPVNWLLLKPGSTWGKSVNCWHSFLWSGSDPNRPPCWYMGNGTFGASTKRSPFQPEGSVSFNFPQKFLLNWGEIHIK